MSLTILACQIKIPANMQTRQDRNAHLRRIASFIDSALYKRPAALVMLPELSSVSYSPHCFANPEIFAEDAQGPSFEVLAQIAIKHGVHILYGAPRYRAKGKISISQFLIDDKGEAAGVFDKLHMAQFGASMEKGYFVPGELLLVFEIKGFRLAPIICYDMRFAGLADELVSGRKVDVILHAVAFYRDASFYSWHSFVVTRALENQVYWLSLNRAGEHYGNSVLCPPWVDKQNPETILNAGEERVYYEIDKQVIAQAKQEYTFAQDRIHDYASLSDEQYLKATINDDIKRAD